MHGRTQAALYDIETRHMMTDMPRTPPGKIEILRQPKTPPVDEDEYTLTAFGDISLSNIDFVPGPPTDLSPQVVHHKKTAKKDTKLMSGASDAVRLPIVIKKVLPPSPAKASLSRRFPDISFDEMVDSLKRSREAEKSDTSPMKVTSAHQQPFVVHAPQPRRVIDLEIFGGSTMSHGVVENSAPGRPKKGEMKRRPPIPQGWGESSSSDFISTSSVLCEGSNQVVGLVALFIRLAVEFMSYFRSHGHSGDGVEDDWEIVTAGWWHTPIAAVTWTYVVKEDPADVKKTQRRPYHGSLFPHVVASRRTEFRGSSTKERDGETTLNTDLVGVISALDAVGVYERDVGFNYEAFPKIEPHELNPYVKVDLLTRQVSNKDLQVNKDSWNELLEDLMHGPVSEPTDSDGSLESSFSSLGELLNRCASTLSSIDLTSSDGSIDSLVMPSTPKARALYHHVEVKDMSPSGSTDYHSLSPGRSLNASASSFVPTFFSQLNEEPLQFPSLRDMTKQPSLASFTFPTLNPSAPASLSVPAVRIMKDDQGFVTEVQMDGSGSSNDLLPPFLQGPFERTRPRKSRTREMVDRLRSQITPAESTPPPSQTPAKPKLQTNLNVISPKYASHSPSPMHEDLGSSFLQPRRSVSEDGGDSRLSVSGLSTPSPTCEDDDGWIDIAHPATMTSPSQKSKRTRELFLALTRRRTDSLSSEGWKELMSGVESGSSGYNSMAVSQRASVSPSPSPNTPPPASTVTNVSKASNDGWIESSSTTTALGGVSSDPLPTVQIQIITKADAAKERHRKKNASAWLHARTSAHKHHPNPHQHQHRLPHPQQHLHLQPFATATPPNPYGQHPHVHQYLHPQQPRGMPVRPIPYFLPAYPTVAVSVGGYPVFNGMNMPTYGVAMPMQAAPAPVASSSYVAPPAIVRSTKGGVLVSSAVASTGITGAPVRAKHAMPIW